MRKKDKKAKSMKKERRSAYTSHGPDNRSDDMKEIRVFQKHSSQKKGGSAIKASVRKGQHEKKMMTGQPVHTIIVLPNPDEKGAPWSKKNQIVMSVGLGEGYLGWPICATAFRE
jgi:hypothetical protein